MTLSRFGLPLAGVLLAVPGPAWSWPAWSPGVLVSVDVRVEGRQAPLYAAPDGSGRWYLEAREGARYSILLSNRGPQRLAVALAVDGLNVISGERGAAEPPAGDPGRLYVLAPGEMTEVRGWRTSLQEVQRFVFVDEQASYAARAGKANARMGWIEIAVYRERYPSWPYPSPSRRDTDGASAGTRGAPQEGERDRAEEGRTDSVRESPPPAAAPSGGVAARAYPGTGWGPRVEDRAELVSFDPQPLPAERLTLRYEYREALLALGIDPGRWPRADRLRQRERGEDGFAMPPPR
jgi:hypothetical protein